jgi:type II secretory pathway pseudopilin PulG
MFVVHRSKGHTILEVVVAVALFGIMASGLAPLALSAYSRQRSAREQSEGTLLAVQALEAIHSIGRRNFLELTNGNHGLSTLGGKYVLSGTSDTVGSFTRTIIISTAERDVNGILTDSASGTPDTHVKKVMAQLTWPTAGGSRTASLTISTYIAAW